MTIISTEVRAMGIVFGDYPNTKTSIVISRKKKDFTRELFYHTRLECGHHEDEIEDIVRICKNSNCNIIAYDEKNAIFRNILLTYSFPKAAYIVCIKNNILKDTIHADELGRIEYNEYLCLEDTAKEFVAKKWTLNAPDQEEKMFVREIVDEMAHVISSKKEPSKDLSAFYLSALGIAMG